MSTDPDVTPDPEPDVAPPETIPPLPGEGGTERDPGPAPVDPEPEPF